MAVKMILAVDRGNAIGWKDGRLPWQIPEDMKRFKELTSGHDVLMGYNTFKSLNRPAGLPNRVNYIVTKFHADEIVETETVRIAQRNGHGLVNPLSWLEGREEDVWVIGGATLYNQCIQLKVVDEIHVTLVDAHSGADVVLPFDLINWKLFVVHQRQVGVQWNLEYMSTPQQTADGLYYTFLTLKKIT